MKPCPALWKSLVVNWNGDVTVCCTDITMKLKLGNINKQQLGTIMKSANWLRLKHIKGETSDIPVCKDCPGTCVENEELFFKELLFWLIEIRRTDLVKDLKKRFGK